MSLPTIGFVGVGRMGANMARRLKEVGYSIVAVYDARPETAAGVAKELEAKATERVSEVSRLAEVIFTIVTDDSQEQQSRDPFEGWSERVNTFLIPT